MRGADDIVFNNVIIYQFAPLLIAISIYLPSRRVYGSKGIFVVKPKPAAFRGVWVKIRRRDVVLSYISKALVEFLLEMLCASFGNCGLVWFPIYRATFYIGLVCGAMVRLKCRINFMETYIILQFSITNKKKVEKMNYYMFSKKIISRGLGFQYFFFPLYSHDSSFIVIVITV